MGCDLSGFIEYDRSQWNTEDGHPPFAEEYGQPFSVTGEGGSCWVSKDYAFFTCIAGVRSTTEIEPLFPPRGMPENLSPEVERSLYSDGNLGDHNNSWLKLSEIEAAMKHQNMTRDDFGFEAILILDIMDCLTRRLGDDRVRFVFGFNG